MSPVDATAALSARVVVEERGVDVALEVAAGETVALLGPNGAGKSTVLEALVGVLRPDRGRVAVGTRELSGGAWVPPHRRQIALLAQDPLLFPHLSALDNVAFGPRSAGASRAAARDTARRWLAEVGLADLAGRRPHQLSGGQAQRVAVARALAAEPQVLLLDEPMAALDVAVAPALRQVLRRVLAPRTAVVVTHDVLDALLLADRVVVVEDGRVSQSGPTAEVLRRPRGGFAARVAGLNLLAGQWTTAQPPAGEGAGSLRTAEGRLVQGTVEGPAPSAGDAAVAVFAPHAVSVFTEPPGGSPRNAFPVVLTEVEPHGDRLRLRAGDLVAEVTLSAAADLDLAPGSHLTFVVKATEVSVYRT